MNRRFRPVDVTVALPGYDPASQQRWRRLLTSGLLLFVAVGLSQSMPAEFSPPSISCEKHNGVFSNDFSAEFDISSRNCRLRFFSYSPTVRFYAGPPFILVEWEPPG